MSATTGAGRRFAHCAAAALLSTSALAVPPEPISGLIGAPDGYAVRLSWERMDPNASGVLIERCLDAPRSTTEPICEVAAVLQADARTLRHVGLRPWRFRGAAFNADGLSAPSGLTALLGECLQLDLGATTDLPASASQIAALIRVSPEADAGCTDPNRLLAEGYALVAAHSGFDGYRLPAENCGTGGCIYVEYQVDANGCYRGDVEQGVLAGSSPWPTHTGADRTRQICSSGSAREGTCGLYQDGARVDETSIARALKTCSRSSSVPSTPTTARPRLWRIRNGGASEAPSRPLNGPRVRPSRRRAPVITAAMLHAV